MDMNVAGALSAYTYQSTLAQTGSASQALTQALATSQSQVGQASALLAGAGSLDGATALAGGSGVQALASLAYSASAASGNGPEALQAMLATLGGGTSALSSTSDSLPLSAAILSPSTTEALVRYAYDQSQNPKNAEQLAITAGQQALLTSGLNLTA
ncbi:MAG TPA: hypothetical protein VGK03_10775 [Geothrix sp.]|jgi:hypothetical protein